MRASQVTCRKALHAQPARRVGCQPPIALSFLRESPWCRRRIHVVRSTAWVGDIVAVDAIDWPRWQDEKMTVAVRMAAARASSLSGTRIRSGGRPRGLREGARGWARPRTGPAEGGLQEVLPADTWGAVQRCAVLTISVVLPGEAQTGGGSQPPHARSPNLKRPTHGAGQ